MTKKWPLILTWLVLGTTVCSAQEANVEQPAAEDAIPQSLFQYINRPEPAFEWTVRNTTSMENGVLYDVDLVSQTWHGITWKHTLQVHEPQNLRHREHVLLFITGGSNGNRPGRERAALAHRLAQLTRSRVALLCQVPNQPLLGDRVEDDLITETWLRYLDTGDETWPLLFPMVKSAVKAMDAIEQLAEEKWSQPIKGFVVTGASKRGWTSWLAPVVDRRILATAPMVIDTLNFTRQVDYQLETWGKFSRQLEDYESKGLLDIIRKKSGDQSPRERRLRRMMDPFTYRRSLTPPKLIINGTNDPYWVVDALNNYWDDLPGPKYIFYLPNAGHDLAGPEELPSGADDAGAGVGRERVLRTLAAFYRHIVSGTPLPRLDWENGDDGPDRLRLTMQASPSPQRVRLWTATSATNDFRDAKWTVQTMERSQERYVGVIDKPDGRHVAFYGEAIFDSQDLRWSLCTQIFRE